MMKYLCCDQEMRAMGPWPRAVDVYKWSEPSVDGSMEALFDGQGIVMAEGHHCTSCNRYIWVAQEQQPRQVKVA